MSEEKMDWLKIWVVSFIVVIPVAIIPPFLFERWIAPIKTEYLTVFGFWFFVIYGIWIVFSVWCIYQVGKIRKKEERI